MSEQGKDHKLFIENAANDDYIVVANQGDATLTTGRTLEGNVNKDGTSPYFQPDVSMIEFEVDIENPMHSSHTRLLEVSDSEATVKVKFESLVAGGMAFHGSAKVSVSQVSSPVQGIAKFSVKAVFLDEPTRGVSPIAFA